MRPEDLARARWFRAKHRPVGSVTEVDRADVGPGAVVVAEVAYRDGGSPDHYLLTEPERGDGVFAALVRAIAGDRVLDASSGAFVCTQHGGVALAGPMEERLLGVEQSNTSVVIGERLILKLYRLLERGENPDVEVSRFLAMAGFTDTPRLAGSITYVREEGAPAAAAMLQEFVPSVGDAWTVMLGALAADPDAAIGVVRRIGEVTVALHRALASEPSHPAFPARSATVDETAGWRASAERQLSQAVTAVGGEAHDRLVALAPLISARFANVFGAAAGRARVSRIHGDYHLGQLLARADGGYSVIDFEGEPARPLEERRGPSSPLRDVAGMLRSLDYAARTAAREARLPADRWLPSAREAFLDGYGDLRDDDRPLLEAFELEKACYEVRYEAGNRPEWLWLPLSAVDGMVAA